jgi:hypothetical protein
MSDAVTKRYIYPPNWEEEVLGDGGLRTGGHQGGGARRYVLHLTNVSDATGESKVKKVQIKLLHLVGRPAVRTVIEWIEYDVFGMDVELFWETTGSDVRIARLPGGATTQSGKIRGPLTDPRTGDGTDGTGDILLSTVNAASNDSYDIRLCIRPKVEIRPERNN